MVRLVRAIPIQDSSRSNLLVLLDHPDPEVLILNYTEESEPGTGKLNLKHQIPLDERGSRPSELCTDAIVHPSGMFAVVSCYAGRLKVITIEDGEVYNLQLSEINLLSFAFLPLIHEDNYSLAILYIDHKEHVQLVARNLRISTDSGADLDSELSSLLLPTSISLKSLPIPYESLPQLIPIPANDFEMDDDIDSFLGGILVVGGSKILLYELASQDAQEKHKGKRKRDTQKRRSDVNLNKNKRDIKKREPSAAVDWPWSRVSAWTALDNSYEKIFIGDSFGRLAMLSLTNLRDLGMILFPLGETSPATTLSYLSNQVAFVGSHLGDSQITDDKGKGPSLIEPDIAKGCVVATKGSYVEVFQTLVKNIAPISDAVLADLDESGQAHIVTCSGGGNTGSVNIVRIGADFEELGVNASEHSHFFTTTILHSHVFQINSANEVQCVDDLHGFVLDHQTLYIGNMMLKRDNVYGDSSLVIQVTPTAVHLFKYNDVFQRWELEHKEEVGSNQGKYVAASGNASQVMVAQAGGWILSYAVRILGNQKHELVVKANKMDHSQGGSPQDSPSPDGTHPWYNTEISAINCPILDPTKSFGTFVAAAFWHTNQVKVYSLNPSGVGFLCQTPSLPSPVRSVLLNYMTTDSYRIKDPSSHLCLFAGLADGSVVTFEMVFNEESEAPEFKGMNITSLGQLPVVLSAYETDGKRVVVAAGNSLILATASGITIGRVKKLDKMHIRSVSLGLDNPRHIVYAPTCKLFGVSCVRTEPIRVGQDETVTSSFKLLDDSSFAVLAQVDLQKDEQIMSLTVLNVTVNEKLQPLFCVGTTFIRMDEMEPTSGRILLFEPNQVSPTMLQLRRVASNDVPGCVYSLAVVDGMLAAAINSCVSLYRMTSGVASVWVSIPDYALELVAEWNHNYLVNTVSSYNDHLVIADQFSSVSLLKLDAHRKLSTVARDYSPLCPVSVEAFDTAGIIGADQSLNMFTFSLGNAGNRAILKRDGFFHVGDLVTKFIRGSLASADGPSDRGLETTHIFCTFSGKIGVVVAVHPENEILFKTLNLLETRLGLQKSDAVGGISYARHRAPRSSRGRSDADEAAYGIIDGDLLEQMLTYMDTAPELVEDIYGSDEFLYPLTELKKDLELLQTMHCS
ncbi:hypothetical protein BT96DRAFT_992689 [Gymnopus androsaceus JB14]|uniref:DNA damage-binding protein 1 n=1 Tax=Gymnopus androsaceus JB14 TaxID=1447944 RepID=A0A6A4HRP9_9AGAR|nr:hypothetical protein BT96DRAFT_992689 [Gymnopus androsaceus JB14]